MFNWLKNKLNNLIPSDLNKGFLTCNFLTVKVGTNITIPTNTICFVSYHDKIYAELKEGSHSLDKELLVDLYEKQQKKNKKLKHFNVDLFFVNTSVQSLTISYVDKLSVSKKLTKFIVDIKTELKVLNAKVFNKFICAEFYDPKAITTNDFIATIIEDFVKKQFFKINLISSSLPNETISLINDKLSDYLTKLGLSLVNFNISITSKSKKETEEPIKTEKLESNFFASQPEIKNTTKENNLNIVDQTEKLNYNLNEPNPQKENICSACGAKIIKGSIFCHRCGNVLK